jgi:exopolysaccharide production protein ExoQ
MLRRATKTIIDAIAVRSEASATMMFAVSAFLVVSLGHFAYRGLAILFTATAVVTAAWWLAERPSVKLRPAFFVFAAFSALGAASLAWSPRPLESFSTLISALATLLGGGLLILFAGGFDDHRRRFVRRAILAGGIVGYGLFAIELFGNGILMRTLLGLLGRLTTDGVVTNALKPGLTVGALFLWLWSLAIIREAPRWVSIVAIGCAAIILLLQDSHATSLSIFAGALMATIGFLCGRAVISFLCVVIATVVIAAPWLVQFLPDPTLPGSGLEVLPNSAVHRIAIWHTAAGLIFDAPWFGHGFDSSRMQYGRGSVRQLILLPDLEDRIMALKAEPLPLHPHNLMLQIWLELGFAGACLLVAALIVLVKMIAGVPDRAERAAAFGTFGGVLALATVSYGAWQSWWLTTSMLVCAAMASQMKYASTMPLQDESKYKGSRTTAATSRS